VCCSVQATDAFFSSFFFSPSVLRGEVYSRGGEAVAAAPARQRSANEGEDKMSFATVCRDADAMMQR